MKMQIVLDNLEKALNENDYLTVYSCLNDVVRTIVHKRRIFALNKQFRENFITAFITDYYLRIKQMRDRGTPIHPSAIYRYGLLFCNNVLRRFKKREDFIGFAEDDTGVMYQYLLEQRKQLNQASNTPMFEMEMEDYIKHLPKTIYNIIKSKVPFANEKTIKEYYMNVLLHLLGRTYCFGVNLTNYERNMLKLVQLDVRNLIKKDIGKLSYQSSISVDDIYESMLEGIS